MEVYSIGMFDQATAEEPMAIDFMQAVSSMYHKATIVPNFNYSNFTVNGTADTTKVKYNQTVTQDSSLTDIFKNIFGEFSANSGYSTEIEVGKPDTSGYITINDPLGKYMDFLGFDGMVFGETVYNNPTITTNLAITQYTFDGEVSTQLTPCY